MQALHKAKVFIAGGGPVGLTAAIELHRRGFTPRIIDPDMAVPPQSRALAVNPRTLDLLEPSGATEALLAAATVSPLHVRYNTQPLFQMKLAS
jgi:2-polyprenyl-6-methoxyphenol hydroxylase-like FAD-dependent oxidoreductase